MKIGMPKVGYVEVCIIEFVYNSDEHQMREHDRFSFVTHDTTAKELHTFLFNATELRAGVKKEPLRKTPKKLKACIICGKPAKKKVCSEECRKEHARRYMKRWNYKKKKLHEKEKQIDASELAFRNTRLLGVDSEGVMDGEVV